MKSCVQFIVVLVNVLFVCQAVAADKVVVIPFSSTKKLDNVVTVSARGGDFTDPVAAVNSIAGANAANLYLVFIGPGVYTLTQTLVMKPFVTVAGSGRNATTLTRAVDTDVVTAASATVAGADNATLRDLTIENTGGGLVAIALYNDGSSPVIQNVSVTASGGTDNTGIYNYDSSPVITDVSVTATASGGTDTTAIYNTSSSSAVMTSVTATATGGTQRNFGIYNSSSSPSMTQVTATASGGAMYNTGIHNLFSSPSMTYVTATASGGTGPQNTGISNNGSPLIMTNVTATASGDNSYGVTNSNPSTTIRHCTLEGTSAGIYVDAGTTTVVHSSVLGGATLLGGSFTCLFVDDGNGAEYVCP